MNWHTFSIYPGVAFEMNRHRDFLHLESYKMNKFKQYKYYGKNHWYRPWYNKLLRGSI